MHPKSTDFFIIASWKIVKYIAKKFVIFGQKQATYEHPPKLRKKRIKVTCKDCSKNYTTEKSPVKKIRTDFLGKQ